MRFSTLVPVLVFLVSASWGDVRATTIVHILGKDWAITLSEDLARRPNPATEPRIETGHTKVVAFGPKAIVAISGLGRMCGPDDGTVLVKDLMIRFGGEVSGSGAKFDNCAELATKTFSPQRGIEANLTSPYTRSS